MGGVQDPKLFKAVNRVKEAEFGLGISIKRIYLFYVLKSKGGGGG